jgi:hypothetical protein
MQVRRRQGCVATLFWLLIIGLGAVYVVAAVTAPWSFHIGGRWTPLLYWPGYGRLVTKNGSYPLYVMLYPSSHFSRLQLDGVRPTGGVQGSGWLCVSQGAMQRLELSGTIYGGWRSTEGTLMEFRLLEPKVIDTGQRRGYFDLFGRWNGPELVMSDRGESPSEFRSGLKIEQASVTLDWGRYGDFKTVCNAGGN